ncbi:MAG TPA: alpha-1,4-glucan--maltose-1-phosphate maltosyltransferase [Streptosporangiaceae bacterium]|nr:alpha-1,4-glucan--maltose-1-phosphate maltosyltransferase [Streptosporangiaceae bacterium]
MIGRIPILDVQPAVECGRRPAKAVVGESFEVSATVFREGHEMLGAGAVLRCPDGGRGPLTAMRELAEGTDRYGAEVMVTSAGLWHFRVEAWGDPIAGWRHDAAIKVPIGQDVDLMLAQGALLFDRVARNIRPPGKGDPAAARPAAGSQAAAGARAALDAVAARLRDADAPAADRLRAAFSPEITAILAARPLRDLLTRSPWCPVIVHRERALYGSWYEFFPRSEGAQAAGDGSGGPRSGTLKTAAGRLDAVAAMGFDVVYLPPVHPIGTTARKGANNALHAGPGDPGSPWAIGSPAGGHDAIHPDLGTLADFDAFVGRAAELGMEVALDYALQASPDHPWVRTHPEWFTTRADGSIAYAENPPKRYQDIYPLNLDNDPDGSYAEAVRILRHWMSHGIRIFRVDNPHTKPLRFWERLLADVARTDPDVLFLAEAFTRPAMMHELARIGFHQSYTYFTWRNSAAEITGYLRELAGPAAAYMRPNFFVNTPDILCEYLQYAGPAAFRVRAVLAAMLAPSWGVYSGYELCENTPAAPGVSEEYLDSEKYQYRPRDWDGAEATGASIAPFLARLNLIRKAHPALHRLRNLRFHAADQPELLCFSKNSGGAAAGPPGRDVVLVVVNTDWRQPREATIWLDMAALGLDPNAEFLVTDELSGESHRWRQANYVRLDPAVGPAHIFTVGT